MANLKFKVGGVWNQVVTIKGDKGDAGDALPAGGVAGQLLIKNSATDNDATWQNNPSAPLSHTHTIANVTGLQAALDGKVDDSQVLTNVPAGAVFTDTVYMHPTTDGNLHVPATGTTNNGKVLKAGATAGSLVWGTDNDTVYTHPASHPASIITQDTSNRFVTDAEKTTWNGKQNALVSGTNIKTINGSTVLGDGDVELLTKNNPTATGIQTFPSIVTNGIKFPATQVPSADPNTLDDYEKGSFTATFWSGRDKTGTSFTSPNCRYVKIGSIVHLIIFRANFGAGLSVQSVTLPFTINADWLASGTTDTGVAVSNPSGNVDYVNFASAISDVFVRFSFTYKVE